MGMKSVFTGIFIISSMYLLFIHQFHNASAAPGNVNNLDSHRPRGRPFTRLTPRTSSQYARIKPEPFNEFIGEFPTSKRGVCEIIRKLVSSWWWRPFWTVQTANFRRLWPLTVRQKRRRTVRRLWTHEIRKERWRQIDSWFIWLYGQCNTTLFNNRKLTGWQINFNGKSLNEFFVHIVPSPFSFWLK